MKRASRTHSQAVGRAGAILAALVMAGACATQPKPAPPPAPAQPPPSAAEMAQSGLAVVSDADITLNDSSRSREIPVQVSYPDGPGPFPVIVFSHGAGGSGQTVRLLSRFWATHGFVVLAPTHADSVKGRDPTLESMRETAADAAQDPKAWENRARDIAFVIAASAAVEARVPALKGKLDDARVGVGGHSYGAFTAELLAGATVELSKGAKPKSFADPNPKAFLLLSPPGKGQQGLTDKSWATVDRPLMVVTGSRDWGVKNQDPSWRLDAYQLSMPGNKYAVLIEDASSLSQTGLAAEPGATLPRGKGKNVTADEEVAIFKDVKIATLAFWEAFLKGDARSKAFIDSDALVAESDGKAQLLRR
jgi:dienelactone hydrolase